MDIQEEFVDMIQKNQGLIYKISRSFTIGEEDLKDLYQEIVYKPL